MAKGLEVALMGTHHVVSAVILSQQCVRSGLDAYGTKELNRLIARTVLGMETPEGVRRLRSVLGDNLKPVFTEQGVGLHDSNFGLEVFFHGGFTEVDMVGADRGEVHPTPFLKLCRPGDMLAVFSARRDGAFVFRWEDVGEFGQDDLVLSYRSYTPLLGRNDRFELAHDVALKGKKGTLAKAKKVGNFAGFEHVFHKRG